MSTSVKMILAGVGLVLVLGYLIHDSGRPAPDENMLADDREYERVVVVGIDLSGSFLELMAEQGKAWEFLLRVIDRYLRGGANEKLILVQLSGNTRALIEFDAALKPTLSAAGLVTRDARDVERKKVGLHKARRRKQFSKR